ncbi:coiled-coil domain-containing protein 158 [Rhinophrynus dorsalis]
MESKTIQALREQLEGRTREIQQLQKEVEQATQITLNKLSESYQERNQNHAVVNNGCSAGEYNLTQNGLRGSTTCAARQPSEKALDDQEVTFTVSQTNLNDYKTVIRILDEALQRMYVESSNSHEQQKINHRQSVSELPYRNKELQKEKETMLDMRLQGSKSQEESNKQPEFTAQELQTANRLREDMLKQSHVYSSVLKEMVQANDLILLDIRGALLSYEEQSGKKVCEQGPISSLHPGELWETVSKVLQEMNKEMSFLKRKLDSAEEEINYLKTKLHDKEMLSKQHKERCASVDNEYEQKVAALTDEANRARSYAETIQTQMEIFQQQAQEQNAKYMDQMSHLEAAKSQLRSEFKNAKRHYKEEITLSRTVKPPINAQSVKATDVFALHPESSVSPSLEKTSPVAAHGGEKMDETILSAFVAFRLSIEDKPYSKHGALSIINSFYDPLGFVAPVTIQGKFLLGQLLAKSKTWDTPLPIEKRQIWETWKDSLKALEHLQIPHCYASLSSTTVEKKEIYIFSDASMEAITAVAYLKVEDLKEQLQVSNSALTKARNEHAQYSQEMGIRFQQLSEALQLCEEQLSLEREHNKQLCDQDNINTVTNEHLRRELFERSMEVERLEAMVNTMKEESRQQMEQQMVTINERTTSLNFISSQLESTKDVLYKTAQELAAKNLSLERTEKNIERLKTCVEEKDRSLRNTMDELKKLHSHLEAKKSEAQKLKLEVEKLREHQKDAENMKIHLAEKEQMVKALQNQVGNMTHIVGQQSQRLEVLQVQNSNLLEEIREKKTEIQNMKNMAEKKDMKIQELEALLQDLELEKAKQRNSSTEKAREAKELRRERDQLIAELKVTQKDLASLAEDYEVLKRNYQNRYADVDTTTILKRQLKAALAELEQTRNTLSAVENCDGHAIKVAMKMQKKITSKRGQIDALQSRIKFLEEALSSTTKDKRQLKVEKTKLMDENVQETAGRQRMSEELEVLKSENHTLRGKEASMGAALDKALLQLSESQAIIQHLEQECMRLRLQLTLDTKEFKGPNLTAIGTAAKPSYVIGPVSCPDSANLASWQSNLRVRDFNAPLYKNLVVENPTRDVLQLLDKLPFTTSRKPAAQQTEITEDTNKSRANHLLATIDEVTRDKTEKNSRLQSYSREPLTLHTVDLEDEDPTLTITHTENPFLVTPCYTSSPKKYTKDQKCKPKSPVHSLLTAPSSSFEIASTLDSRPLCKTVLTEDFPIGAPSTETTSNTCQKLQSRLESLQTMAEDIQTKNKGTASTPSSYQTSCHTTGKKLTSSVRIENQFNLKWIRKVRTAQNTSHGRTLVLNRKGSGQSKMTSLNSSIYQALVWNEAMHPSSCIVMRNPFA